MPSPASPDVMDEKETPMKFEDVYYESSDMTPEGLQKPVLLLDELTGATYEAKKFIKADKKDGGQFFITF